MNRLPKFNTINNYFEIIGSSGSYKLQIPKGYGPPVGGLNLAKTIDNCHEKDCCDIGSGYFALNAITALSMGAKKAFGLEIDDKAYKWSDKLKTENKIDNLNIKKGETLNVFGNIKFDCIFANLPMLPHFNDSEVESDPFHFGGRTGWEILQHYISEIPLFLKPNGYARFLLIDFLGVEDRYSANIPSFKERVADVGMKMKILSETYSQINENHPFIKNKRLFEYVKKIYHRYNFDNGYSKTIIEIKFDR